MKKDIRISTIICTLILSAAWYACKRTQSMTACAPLQTSIEKWNDSILPVMEQTEDSLSKKYAYFPKINLNEEEKKLTPKEQERLRIEKMGFWAFGHIKDRSILREPRIIPDANPFSKLIIPLTSSATDTIDVYGKTFEELRKEYQLHDLIWHTKDTLCFGMDTKEDGIPMSMENRYRLLHIHYAEVHLHIWRYRGTKKAPIEIYLIHDGDSLRAFSTGIDNNRKTSPFS